MTREDYLWNYSVPLLRIMSMDYSHERILTQSEKDNKNNQIKKLQSESGVDIF